MSTAFAFDPIRSLPALPVGPAPEAAPPRTATAPAVRRAARPRVLAASAVLGGIVCVVAAQLLLSIGTANGAYRLASLEQRSDLLSRQQQVQEETLRSLAAPQRLAAEAKALGMVQGGSPAYLDARTGKVLGKTTATPSGLTR